MGGTRPPSPEGTGDEWVKSHQYFDKAWTFVLGNLQKRFAEGPIDWKSM